MKLILFYGPPGSGKSTQAQMLANHLGIPHISAGDLLHLASKGEDEISEKIREQMKRGEIVDDRLTTALLTEHLRGKEHETGTVLDGFPRNLNQAELFPLPIEKVFYLKVSDTEATRRLTARGREDDKPAVIQKRLETYRQETQPLIRFYQQKGILEEIDGEKKPEETFAEIKRRISS